jgi:hypothetical protein
MFGRELHESTYPLGERCYESRHIGHRTRGWDHAEEDLPQATSVPAAPPMSCAAG